MRRSIRDGLPRTRKKDGAYPFALLSSPPAQYSIEDAVGRPAGDRKRIAARRREEAEPEGNPAKSPEGRPFPLPKLSGSDAPHVWAAQFSRMHLGAHRAKTREASARDPGGATHAGRTPAHWRHITLIVAHTRRI